MSISCKQQLFWVHIYIYISHYIYRERDRDIIKFCVCVVSRCRPLPATSKVIRLKASPNLSLRQSQREIITPSEPSASSETPLSLIDTLTLYHLFVSLFLCVSFNITIALSPSLLILPTLLSLSLQPSIYVFIVSSYNIFFSVIFIHLIAKHFVLFFLM